jgi:hypothetical protein
VAFQALPEHLLRKRIKKRPGLYRTGTQDSDGYSYIKQLSSVQQEVFTHRHDRHQTSVSKAVARVVEVTWLMKKS